MATMQPESVVVARIRRALEARGCLTVKMHGSRFMPEGFPDLLVVLPGGETVYLEVKVPGRTDGPWGCGLSAMQLRWLWKLGAQGCRVSFADSATDAIAFCIGQWPGSAK